jgi:transposase InsO family protein
VSFAGRQTISLRYVILDIFSRYVVGWMIAHREAAELAEQLIADTIDKQNIVPGTLTLHADRGTSMRSKSVAQCSSISTSPKLTAVRTSRTTIRIPRRSSKP